MATQTPTIGEWYQDAQQDDVFEVVAVDDSSATIEIQYLGGEVSELDVETWQQMVLLPAKPPEDFNASYELSNEDLHSNDDVLVPERLDNPVASMEAESLLEWDEF